MTGSTKKNLQNKTITLKNVIPYPYIHTAYNSFVYDSTDVVPGVPDSHGNIVPEAEYGHQSFPAQYPLVFKNMVAGKTYNGPLVTSDLVLIIRSPKRYM